jgi:hypothetical protein
LLQDTNIIFKKKTILNSLYGKEDSVIYFKGDRYPIQFQSTYTGVNEAISNEISVYNYLKQEIKRGYFIQNGIAQKTLSINYIYLDLNRESYVIEFYYKIAE